MRAYNGKGVRVVYDVVRLPRVTYGESLRSAADVAELVTALQERAIIPREREAFCVLALDARHRTIGVQVVSVGTANGSSVHPRETFRFAVAVGAVAIIIAHNHPTGDPAPSPEDRTVTERIRECGETLGIELLDHVIVASAGDYFSFAEARPGT